MGGSKNYACRLCLGIVNGENCKTVEDIKEMLVNLLLNPQLKENEKNIVCDVCYAKLSAAVEFKAACMDTENIIYPYINSEGGSCLDLNEIFLKEKGCDPLLETLNDVKICRLCMKLTTVGFVELKEVEDDLIHSIVPEMNLTATEEPVVCKHCLDNINSLGDFVNNCLQIEEKFSTCSFDGDVDHCGALSRDLNVKTEEINIKSEPKEQELLIKTEHIEVKSEEWEEGWDANCLDQDDEFVEDETRFTSDLNLKRDESDFETKSKDNVAPHQPKRKNNSEVFTFKCDECSFETKHRSSIWRHQVKHKKASEVQTYKCGQCDYKSIDRSNFLRHNLIHEDPSKVQIYKCDRCSYESRDRSNFFRHKLKHKKLSDMRIFECDQCEYKTKHKRCLPRHKLMHENGGEAQMCKPNRRQINK